MFTALISELISPLTELHVEIERLRGDGFVLRVVVLAEVGVLQGLRHRDPLVGVEGQHLLQQVEGLGVGLGVDSCEGDLWSEGERGEVAARLVIEDGCEVLLCGGAQHAHDVVELVQVVLAGEDGAVGEHLRQDAAHGPHVNRLVVTLKTTISFKPRQTSHNMYL